jgi:hypothetical protein
LIFFYNRCSVKANSTRICNSKDLSVLVIVIGITAILFSGYIQVYAVKEDNITSNPEIALDREPLYRSTGGNVTNMKEISANQTEISFTEKGVMKNIGNVTNTGTFIENSSDNGRLLHGAGKGTITTENGDTINWKAYDLGNKTGNTFTYKGFYFFDTNSEKLASVDNVIGLYIHSKSDANNLRQIWEWK